MRPLDGRRIRAAIETAQSGTTGRIGVRIVPHETSDPLETAREHFARAGLHEHPHRNAVIFLIAPRSRKFAVFGGEAIHERVGSTFWSQLVSDMQVYFVKNQATDALALGIARVGDELRLHFPSSEETPT
jgi:uncharacterized membrane protein